MKKNHLKIDKKLCKKKAETIKTVELAFISPF